MDDQTAQWVQKTWRPAIGVTYIIINVFDFIIFPVLWTITGFFNGNHVAWHPLTLESTGLFHMAFGAILGVAAWNRDLIKPKQPSPYEPYDRYQDYSNTYEYRRPQPPPRISPRVPSRYNDEPTREPSSVYRGENNDR